MIKVKINHLPSAPFLAHKNNLSINFLNSFGASRVSFSHFLIFVDEDELLDVEGHGVEAHDDSAGETPLEEDVHRVG
jgi:hypothetical protein